MKGLKSIKFYSVFAGFLGLSVIFSTAYAQEYDDMYFNKSDRKKVKAETKSVYSTPGKSANNLDYNEATKSTEVYSAKNINPEYIARYKATESNEVTENTSQNGYTSDDYFIENYNTPDSAIGIHQNQIDYAALNKRDQMSYSHYNNSYSNPFWGRPTWGFSPYMSMGYGYPYGYDPFMMGYGSGMMIGMSYGFGSGFYPSMSYSLGMSYGMGYNPWGGWGAYPYSPYRMRGFYGDPWGYGSPYYAYNGYSPYSYYGYGMGSYYGYSRPYAIVTASDLNRSSAYKARTTNRSATVRRTSSSGSENIRVSSADSKIRVPNRTTSVANGRVSRDYSKTQNEYYRSSRSTNNASIQRISISNSSRSAYARTSRTNARYNTSSISSNRPSRLSNSSSGVNRSSGRSYSNYGNSRSSSSYSPSRSSSGSSFNRSSSFSGGSRSFSTGGSRSSGSSGSRSSSSSSRSGGRQ